jgi:precorrin-6B methylase 2
MKNDNDVGELCEDISYSVKDIYTIKKSNFFWWFVDIFSCKMEKLANIYQKSMKETYIREGKKFNLENSKNILHIGCGAYPVTTITLTQFNGGKITGIDKKSLAVKFAKNIIKKKKLDNQIKIEVGDGINYPIDDFDTIIISGCSIPKMKVLYHILKKAKPNTKIIVRELYSSNNVFDKCINANKNIKIVNRIGNNPFKTSHWESIYLIKK